MVERTAQSATKGTILYLNVLDFMPGKKKPLVVFINIMLSSNMHKEITGNWTDVVNT